MEVGILLHLEIIDMQSAVVLRSLPRKDCEEVEGSDQIHIFPIHLLGYLGFRQFDKVPII